MDLQQQVHNRMDGPAVQGRVLSVRACASGRPVGTGRTWWCWVHGLAEQGPVRSADSPLGLLTQCTSWGRYERTPSREGLARPLPGGLPSGSGHISRGG